MIKKIILITIVFFVCGSISSFSDMAPEAKKSQNELQRKAQGYYDIQRNTISNIEFSINNTGMIFHDVPTGLGTGIWPRGSVNYYIFGGGIWVGGLKKINVIDSVTGEIEDTIITITDVIWDRENPIKDAEGNIIGYNMDTVVTFDTAYKKAKDPYTIMSVTYNPYNAKSFMVPGRMEDGETANTTNIDKYRVFFSMDYNTSDGSPRIPADGTTVWPIWDIAEGKVVKHDRYFGKYVLDEKKRNMQEYPKGPAFISGEDIFCTYKDSDLSKYSFLGGVTQLKGKGYPLGIQYEQMVYSWGFGDYRDFIFVKYDQINMSPDTLYDVWLAPMLDVDIAFANNPTQGADNDRCSFYGMEDKETGQQPDEEKAKKNFAYQWSDGNRGEQGRGFGYLAFVFLESPATVKKYADINEFTGDTLFVNVDSLDFVRRDKPYYTHEEQLGLVTFRNWSLGDDPKTDIDMYNFISRRNLDGDTGPGDKRYMMATGPFNMRPQDTARTVVGMVFAGTCLGGDAQGTDEDLCELVRKVDFAQSVYDNNFRAPQPPWRTNITEWKPINNGMIIKWDDYSEQSTDNEELGLDFMGYQIYRARRSNLDTFNVDDISPSSEYPAGMGPFGWKLLQEYEINTPFYKHNNVVFSIVDDEKFRGIDSMMVIGPVHITPDSVDLNAIRVMRIPRGFNMYPPEFIDTALALPAWAQAYTPKLVASGFLTDETYGKRIVPVINSIDTSQQSVSTPWNVFYNKVAKQVGVNFGSDVLYYQEQHNYLVDSILVGTLYLNPSLAQINPLFYTSKTVPITRTRYNELKADTINNGAVWITKTYLDTIKNKDDKDTVITIVQKIKIDTLYQLDTYDTLYDGNNRSYTIRAMVPLPESQMLKSMEHFRLVRDSVYSYISKGWIREYAFYDFHGSQEAKDEVIKPYMNKITNGRTFVDIGDDNHDGVITTNDDIGKTEQMFNNVEYYYKVVSYDEGDFTKPSPSKTNEGLPGLPNFAETYPAAERVGNKLEFNVIELDTAKMMGLYDFDLYAIDPDRASQLFTGDTIEVEFNASPSYVEPRFSSDQNAKGVPIGLYYTNMKLSNISKGTSIFDGTLSLEPGNCNVNFNELYTEYTASRVFGDTAIITKRSDGTNDTNRYGTMTSDSICTFSNLFTTGDFQTAGYCYNSNFAPEAYGTLGLNFRSAVKQFGGIYRPYLAEKTDAGNTKNTTTVLTPLPLGDVRDTKTDGAILITRQVGFNIVGNGYADGPIDYSYRAPIYGRFNNGPGVYEVEFTPGGEEELLIQWNAEPDGKKFKVKYLIPKVTNKISYKRAAEERDDVDSVDVVTNMDIKHLELPVQPYADGTVVINGFSYPNLPVPSPLNMMADTTYPNKPEDMMYSFNLYAQAFINCRKAPGALAGAWVKGAARDADLLEKYDQNIVEYVGKQGKYYLTAISDDGKDTLDFVHTFNIAGCQFIADYLGRAHRDKDKAYVEPVPQPQDVTHGNDFAAGDVIKFTTFGGTLGFPQNGAKVKFVVSQTNPQQYTDQQLDGIKVVPNPYVISHQGQKSPYDARIYFTKLPEKCTITIYSAAGDLVKTIEYDEVTNAAPKFGVDIWDLLTNNGQRVESQTLVAMIKTPDGAVTTKQFAIVVGGFRIID